MYGGMYRLALSPHKLADAVSDDRLIALSHPSRAKWDKMILFALSYSASSTGRRELLRADFVVRNVAFEARAGLNAFPERKEMLRLTHASESKAGVSLASKSVHCAGYTITMDARRNVETKELEPDTLSVSVGIQGAVAHGKVLPSFVEAKVIIAVRKRNAQEWCSPCPPKLHAPSFSIPFPVYTFSKRAYTHQIVVGSWPQLSSFFQVDDSLEISVRCQLMNF